MNQLSPIPAPRGLPLVGNALQVPVEGPNPYFTAMAERHPDGIYRLDLAGRDVVMVYDPDLVTELSDETRFFKPIDPPLAHVRDFAGDGLFTATDGETSWGQAHRILLPAFSQRSMKAYFPQMLEVAQDLVRAWHRDPGRDLNVTDDMTRLTLDTIALTGFDHAFHSFDAPELHPFLQAMGRALTEAMTRTRQLPVITGLKKRQNEAYQADIRAMQELVDEVIRERRAAGATGGRDLLGLMLEAADPQTGGTLTDENIRNQVLTFLIAGHETTSGTLAFALYQLLRHPHVLAQAYAEVDRLLPGDTVPTYDIVMKLDVIPRILDETLRLLSPIPVFGLMAYEDTVIGDRYALPKGQKVGVLLRPLHTHPRAWENPEEFDIDRWLPERKANHHPHAYKPFGNGERACIGRQFALTEARLALALVLQHFAIADPYSYHLKIKQTLTIKPDDFSIRVRPRRAHERITAAAPAEEPRQAVADLKAVGVKLTVGYGSNLGTSEELAQQVADRAGQAGFDVSLSTLDDLADAPPTDGLFVAVTSSYNGKAPDNAQRFDGVTLPALPGLRYAVLGIGNTQWVTYQAFPKRIEEALDAAGATAVVPRGEVDAAGDFDGMATAWLDGLWTALAEQYGAQADAPTGNRWTVEVLDESQVRPAVVSEQAYPITVISVDELVGDPAGLWDFSLEAPRPGARSISAQLPAGVEYATGNHLAVFAKNDPELVAWALDRLRTPRDRVIRLTQNSDRRTHLPVGVPVTAELLLTEFVELQEVATRGQLATLAAHTECPWTARNLTAWTTDDQAYADEIMAKRVSVLSLLERFPAIELPLGDYLETAGPIRARFYSISSSPRAEPGRPRLTVGLVEGDAWSGSGRYRGMCSQYLARLRPGDVFYGHVRVPSPPFEPPADPATPMILIGPGTGFAPLRGFLQERALSGGGPVKLFYGCRHPEHDWLYRDEVEQWARDGVCEVHTAFSAVPDHPYRFVQQAVAADADGVWDLLDAGAHVYLCGDGARMAPAVRAALGDIYHAKTGGDAEAWLRELEETGRYQQDVFA